MDSCFNWSQYCTPGCLGQILSCIKYQGPRTVDCGFVLQVMSVLYSWPFRPTASFLGLMSGLCSPVNADTSEASGTERYWWRFVVLATRNNIVILVARNIIAVLMARYNIIVVLVAINIIVVLVTRNNIIVMLVAINIIIILVARNNVVILVAINIIVVLMARNNIIVILV